MNDLNGDGISRVALYMRVSKEEQAKSGYSLGSQLERLRALCVAREWTIAAEYTDPGYTGRNTRRPMYQKMFEEMNMWDAVLVIKMDRIHRNQKNFLAMMEYLKNHDKGFVSMTESWDTSTAMGRFVMNIMAGVAQLESEQISERVVAGLLQKADTPGSGWMGNHPPYGFRYDKIKKKMHPVPKELEIVKEANRIYLEENISMTALAERLEVGRCTVIWALVNPIYTGWVRWGEYLRRTGLEPVISRETYNKVQKKKRLKNRGQRHLNPYLIPEDNGQDIIKLDPADLDNTAQYTRPRHNSPW